MKQKWIKIGILLLSIFLTMPGYTIPPKKIKLYMAAALFNGRETRFNLDLVNRLEAKDYQTFFPQRDGFEYKFLRQAVSKFLPENEVVESSRNMIYLLDMGVFIPESDVIVANLDEPLDDGVIVELTYAHLMGKPVIGYRTDVRTPFGGAEGLGGMHSFVAAQCNYLIREHMSDANDNEANASMTSLVDKIDRTIRSISLPKQASLPDYALANPEISKLIQTANLIIRNANEIHTANGLKNTIKRLAEHREEVKKLNMAKVIT